MNVLSLRDVSAGYNATGDTLKACSLDVALGQRIAIIGENGSGKSTLLRVAAGLLKPTAGTATYHGTRNPAFLLQNPRQQLICSTVREEIEFTLRMQGNSSEAVKLTTESLLKSFFLNEIAESSPQSLSGGQQQRVALAALLTRESELLLLDEPEAFLDGVSRREFRQFFAAHVRSSAVLWSCCRESEVPPGFEVRILRDGALSVGTATVNNRNG
ncbi:energy-coupling factor ABC transporter ATP-binding protein [bacterium]|nr:energy-coupling factor ABC transporter ATP-binding protein [bacterium]